LPTHTPRTNPNAGMGLTLSPLVIAICGNDAQVDRRWARSSRTPMFARIPSAAITSAAAGMDDEEARREEARTIGNLPLQTRNSKLLSVSPHAPIVSSTGAPSPAVLSPHPKLFHSLSTVRVLQLRCPLRRPDVVASSQATSLSILVLALFLRALAQKLLLTTVVYSPTDLGRCSPTNHNRTHTTAPPLCNRSTRPVQSAFRIFLFNELGPSTYSVLDSHPSHDFYILLPRTCYRHHQYSALSSTPIRSHFTTSATPALRQRDFLFCFL